MDNVPPVAMEVHKFVAEPGVASTINDLTTLVLFKSVTNISATIMVPGPIGEHALFHVELEL